MDGGQERILLENCKNIKRAEITIKRNCLNAKLGLNGTGKSTIAQAVLLHAEDSSLEPLYSFEYYANNQDNSLEPKVASPFCRVSVFNEEYVDSYLFRETNLVGEGFDLVIRTKEMDEKEGRIRAMVAEMAAQLNTGALEAALQSFGAFTALMSLNPTNTALRANCKVVSGLKEGNPLEASRSILPALDCYFEDSIEKQSNWAKWHANGKNFVKQDTCPFCGEKITEGKTASLEELDKMLGSKGIDKLSAIFDGFARIAPYLTTEDVQKLERARKQKTPITEEQKNELFRMEQRVSSITKKITALRGFLGAELQLVNEGIDALEKIDEYFVNENDLAGFSLELREKFADLLKSQQAIREKRNELVDAVRARQNELKSIIGEREHEINSFLESVNYPYVVCVSSDNGVVLTLRPRIQKDRTLANAHKHLSYGERNALALILFAYSALYSSEEKDLIILDDPISSFDADKRYSLIYTLFSPPSASVMDRTFSERTVLLLTHDYPLIADLALETVGILRKKVFSWYLSCNENGALSEKKITLTSNLTDKDGLQPFVVMQKRKIRDTRKHDFVRISCLRRLLEYEGATKPASDLYFAWNVLSQLMHGRPFPVQKGQEGPIDGFPLGDSSTDYGRARSTIEEYMGDGFTFDYAKLVSDAQDKENLLSVYKRLDDDIDKLQICRLALGEENLDELGLMARYLNETCHVSGDYLFQLDSGKFQVIPRSAMRFFDEEMEKIAKSS